MPHKRAKKSIRDAATASKGFDNPPVAADAGHGPIQSTSTASGSGVLAPPPAKKKKKVQAKDKTNAFGGRSDMGGMSKSVHRILNAGTLREEYNAKRKQRLEEEAQGGKGKNQAKNKITPMPYETLSAFNRRVEVAMRPSIDSAIRASKASSSKKKAKKAAAEAAEVEEEDATAKEGGGGDKKGKAKATVDPFVPRPKPQHAEPKEFAVASNKRSLTDIVTAPPTLKKAKRGVEAGPSMHDPIPSGRMPVSGEIKKMMEMEREKAVRLYRELKEIRELEKKQDS